MLYIKRYASYFYITLENYATRLRLLHQLQRRAEKRSFCTFNINIYFGVLYQVTGLFYFGLAIGMVLS